MKVIIISGSVATGKSTLAKTLAKALHYQNLDVHALIKKGRLAEGYDKKRQAAIIDTIKLNKSLQQEIAVKRSQKIDGIIIDSHLAHQLPKKLVDLCIITKCDIATLAARLKKRRYKKNKISENIECEVFDICLNEAKEASQNIFVIDTTQGINKTTLRNIKKAIRK